MCAISYAMYRKMADYQQDTKYPPGWDCKYDTNTGKW